MTSRLITTEAEMMPLLAESIQLASELRVMAGPLWLEGLAALLRGTSRTPVKLLLSAPGAQTIEDLAGEHAHSDDLSLAYQRATTPAASRQLEELRINVGRAVAQGSQSEEIRALLVNAAGRLRSRSVEVRLLRGACPSTRFVVFDGTERALVSSESLLLLGVPGAEAMSMWVEGSEARALAQRFAEAWASARAATPAILEELERSWALVEPAPFLVYLKLLQHYTEWGTEPVAEELLWDDEVFTSLTDFQRDAVRSAARIIRRHNGCFVSDVVGLGKTFVGAALLKLLERTLDQRALIVCPAPLVDQWQAFVERFELAARVVSVGQMSERSALAPAFRLETSELRGRQIVLIDESHAFRHMGTQRYELMQTFLSTGRKVILLTATPLNRSPWDVHAQLRLFHPEDHGLPVTPPHLQRFFKAVEDGKARLPDLLGHVLVRRTRRDVIRLYGRDAESGERVEADRLPDYLTGRRTAFVQVGPRQQTFPRRRLETLDYSLEQTYDGIYDEIRRTIMRARGEGVVGLTYAYYDRMPYVRSERRADYRALATRSLNLAGLIRVLLFKRLESSVAALRATLGRMISAHEALLARLGGTASAASEQDDLDPDVELGVDEMIDEVGREVRLTDLDLASFSRALERDLDTLKRLQERIAPITPSLDAKLTVLLRLLATAPLDRQKVLVFTQFSDTAEYLGSQLQSELDGQVAVATSQRGRKSSIVARFAPAANPEVARRTQGPEIRVLVATDVLSEGLNLQDCNVVVNYDLHWNPVRLIQRFGRVDRIGTEHTEILAYNFLPEAKLDAHLGLAARLRGQIAAIHDVIGEDAAILDPGEQLNDQALYAIYSGDLETLGELEACDELTDGAPLEAEAALRDAHARDPDRVLEANELPDGVRAAVALEAGDDREGVVVLLRAEHELRLLWSGPDGQVEEAAPGQLLNRATFPVGAEGQPVPAWVGSAVEAARRHFRAELELRLGDRLRRRRLPSVQRTLLDRLAAMEVNATDRARVELLRATFDDEQPQAVQRRLRTVLQEEPSDDQLLRVLGRIYHDHGLGRLNVRRGGIEPVVPIQVVCSISRVRVTAATS